MGDNAYRRAVLLAAIRVGANAVMLAAACLGMYRSYLFPEEGLLVFCSWFFGMTVPGWALARILSGQVRRRLTDSDQSLVRLPGSRRSGLVRWRVAEPPCSISRPGAKP